MAVDDPLKPVVATKEAKPNYVEHLIGPGDDAEEGKIVDGDVDESGKSTVPESHPSLDPRSRSPRSRSSGDFSRKVMFFVDGLDHMKSSFLSVSEELLEDATKMNTYNHTVIDLQLEF
ncbi:hypothetical protein HID58_028741 [Brassica napus]|uniref:Uncharacterized protein n=1 Tax=Brassica napus TaxID=3708 RepID=A0ABQ8CB71_BRANA|nr:hypothetical protein HID58_028741 [Brassica napus]